MCAGVSLFPGCRKRALILHLYPSPDNAGSFRTVRLFLLCQPLFHWEIPGGPRRARVREGRRGAERGRLPLPYLTRHLALAVAAAGCDDEDDEPPPSKRILRELRRWQRRRDTHSVSFPAGRVHPPGETCEEATTRPASASSPQCLAAVPMHLLTCLSVQGGWGRDEGCRAGWVEGEGGQGKRGGARGFRPPGGSAQAQWPVPQAGGGNMAE